MIEMMLTGIPKAVGSPVGQQDYITAGAFKWVCPEDVFTVCVAMVGGGQSGSSPRAANMRGGQGGGVRWLNAIPVVPGTSYDIVVGSGGVDTTVTYNLTITASGGGSSSAFGVTAGLGATGTTIAGAVGGQNGCRQGASNNAVNTTTQGGDSGSYVLSAPIKYDSVPAMGLTLATGSMLTGRAGAGGSARAPMVDNGGYPKTTYRGYDGAVRIIWGANRAFPNKNIGNK